MILDRKTKKLFSKLLRKSGPGTPPVSLLEAPRYGDRDEYGYTEYGFLDLDGTDAEIEEFLNEFVRLRIWSPYDCSGERFTICISYHRNPNGMISYIHTVGIDL